MLAGVLVSGCDNQQKEDEKLKLAQQVNASMITIDGGRFQMGDFGPELGEKLPYSPGQDNKPLHWVELSNFEMTKNRITWGQFNQWLYIQGKNKTKYYNNTKNNKYAGYFIDYLADEYLASVSWHDANDFCHWIGKEAGINSSLPTEAQWEYSARSGGKYYIFANKDNKYNNSLTDDKLDFTHKIKPVGQYPPNPLGLNDMMGNGHDWMNDWYSPDYYETSPMKNPQGPDRGNEKVIRGYTGSMFGLMTITRSQQKPNYEGPGYGFRCAVTH